jgi:hypothetical protein
MIRRAAAVLLAATALLAACGGGGTVEEVGLSVRIEAAETEIKTRIGPAVCSVDGDCRALPMGALACGGPSGFLPYSIRGTDEGALSRLSEEHQRLSREQLQASGAVVGPCIALLPPVPRCEPRQLSCKL